jgi:hypothetical protein
MLSQLIYHSHFVPGQQGALSVVRHIIETSEINNSRDRITGFLIFDKSTFLQILEGDADRIDATFQRISADKRHRDLNVISRRSLDQRAFQDWAMGGYVRSTEAQSVYARYGVTGELDPINLDADTIVRLAADLLDFETNRQKERVVGNGGRL